ncbi:hypothetical protein BC628DRAFT_1400597 [Trametes gibbosa]|nr:hypothetical protein BC628DRAFT_1400597 [Trametes gibbosa]
MHEFLAVDHDKEPTFEASPQIRRTHIYTSCEDGHSTSPQAPDIDVNLVCATMIIGMFEPDFSDIKVLCTGTHAITAILVCVFAFLPGAKCSDCWKDLRGREHCGISPAERIGLGFAVVTGLFVVFFGVRFLCAWRARRKRRAYATMDRSPAAVEEARTPLSSRVQPIQMSIPSYPPPVYDVQMPNLSYLPPQPPAYVPRPPDFQSAGSTMSRNDPVSAPKDT